MPKILQINCCLNLSTGRIVQQIGDLAKAKGCESWVTYSGREQSVPSKSIIIKVGTFVDACIHYAGQRLFDSEGLFSSRSTRKFIEQIEQIKPDIIHLHNIHDHWLNYSLLFKYLAERNIPVVWTQHDCWSFTGGCMYFDMLNCEKWRSGCIGCPDKRTIILNQSESNFKLKKELLANIKSLTYVPVSDWLADMIKVSVQKDRPIITIHNGTDLQLFKPMSKANAVDRKFRILGVAAVWHVRKGLNDFKELCAMLSGEYEITLVGLTKKQIKSLPAGIAGVTRTSSAQELAQLYSDADVFVNPTYSDNFPTTNIEALACGTPVITYRTGGSPEAVDENTGAVVEQGNIDALCAKIIEFKETGFKQKHTGDCRKRAEEHFDKDKCFEKYIELYEELLKK